MASGDNSCFTYPCGAVLPSLVTFSLLNMSVFNVSNDPSKIDSRICRIVSNKKCKLWIDARYRPRISLDTIKCRM